MHNNTILVSRRTAPSIRYIRPVAWISLTTRRRFCGWSNALPGRGATLAMARLLRRFRHTDRSALEYAFTSEGVSNTGGWYEKRGSGNENGWQSMSVRETKRRPLQSWSCDSLLLMKQNRADHSVAEFKHMRSGIGPLSRETIAASLSMSAPTLPKSCHHDDDRSRPRCLLLLFGYFLPLWSLPSQSIAIYVRSPVPSSLPSLESCRHLSSLALGFLR